MQTLFLLLLFAQAVFLILLVLVQRGRGGGLAGALGGPGGSSAFGAKAGDAFTRFTVIFVTIWILTCIAASYWARNRGDVLGDNPAPPVSSTQPIGDGSEEPAAGDDESANSEADEAPADDASADETAAEDSEAGGEEE